MVKKLKTVKSLVKRFQKTKNGFVRKQSNKGHLMSKKNSKRKRKLSRVCFLTKIQTKLVSKCSI